MGVRDSSKAAIYDNEYVDSVFAELRVAVIGLGYVGLPLTVAFGCHRDVIGFDLDSIRIDELQGGFDSTGEVSGHDLRGCVHATFTNDSSFLADRNCYIVAVPTPITEHKKPDLDPLVKATELIGTFLNDGDIVIYESTVYPGVTDEVCAPILNRVSGLRYESDDLPADKNLKEKGGRFFCGYSPERINPGDKTHRLADVVKVTSGSTVFISEVIDRLYKQIVTAGTHKAQSIKIAEAAKVIENSQRDLNIALTNEIAIICDKLGIDTHSVLNAAATKWNFTKYVPGLVGGHCIGVDPYYLTFKAEELGYSPQVLLAGRALNDRMSDYLASKIISIMECGSIVIAESKVLVMGATFKENCPDTRNSKVFKLVDDLKSKGISIEIYDPYVKPETFIGDNDKYSFINVPKESHYDAVVIAVAHLEFVDLGIQRIKRFGKPYAKIFDIKSAFPANETDFRL